MANSKARKADTAILAETLQSYGLTATEISQVVGAVPGANVAWGSNRVTPTSILERLNRLHEIAFLLSDILDHDEVGPWFREGNRILRGYTPLEMIALNGYDQVLAAAAAKVDGLVP